MGFQLKLGKISGKFYFLLAIILSALSITETLADNVINEVNIVFFDTIK